MLYSQGYTQPSRLAHLRKLFGNVPSYKHSLQVDPQVLHYEPFFQDFCRIGEIPYPLLDVLLEGSIVSGQCTYGKVIPRRAGSIHQYLFDMSDPSIIRESSINETIAEVSSPFSSISPRALNVLNLRLCTAQSAFTCFSLNSMSFSFTALIHMSCGGGQVYTLYA